MGAQEFLRRVEQTPIRSRRNATPCPGLTVWDVVNHVVAGNIFAVRLLTGAGRDTAVAGLDADHLGDDAVRAVDETCREQIRAFNAVGDLDAMCLPHPAGDITAYTFLRFRLGELVVHAWDVARGAGLDETLDAELVAEMWRLVEPALADMAVSTAFGKGASGTVLLTADMHLKVLDAFGRRP